MPEEQRDVSFLVALGLFAMGLTRGDERCLGACTRQFIVDSRKARRDDVSRTLLDPIIILQPLDDAAEVWGSGERGKARVRVQQFIEQPAAAWPCLEVPHFFQRHSRAAPQNGAQSSH
jgi:hypothetical protein